MLFSKYPPSPLGWVWVVLLTLRGETRQPKDKNTVPSEQLESEPFPMDAIAVYPRKLPAMRKRSQKFSHGRLSMGKMVMRKFVVFLSFHFGFCCLSAHFDNIIFICCYLLIYSPERTLCGFALFVANKVVALKELPQSILSGCFCLFVFEHLI